MDEPIRNEDLGDTLYKNFVEKLKTYLGSHPSPFMFGLPGTSKHEYYVDLLQRLGLTKQRMETKSELDPEMNGNNCTFTVVDEGDYTYLSFEDFCEEMEKKENAEPVYDISWIRKRMKCCKNPMERKQLEKQLNAAYKARKKARNKR